MPFSGWRSFSLLDQLGEAVAVFGEVDGIRRGAEDRHAGFFQRAGQLQRRLAAELHDHAVQRAALLFGMDDLEHVFGRQRFEIEPVGGVVVGRDGFRVAVDHDGFKAGIMQREAGVAAAIIELDALADAVGTAAEDDDLLACRDARLRCRSSPARPRLVGRVHIGVGEANSAAQVSMRLNTGRTSSLRRCGAHLGFVLARQLGKARVGKAHRLELAQILGVFRQALRFDRALPATISGSGAGTTGR